MSSLIDQADESEVTPATWDQVDQWMSAYVTKMGSPPAEEEEPSEAQLAALRRKTFVLKGPPYFRPAHLHSIWSRVPESSKVSCLPSFGGRVLHHEGASRPRKSATVVDIVAGV